MINHLTSGVIAVVITVITFFLLEWAHKDTQYVSKLPVSEPSVVAEDSVVAEEENWPVESIQQVLLEPDIYNDTQEQFVNSLDQCIDFVYQDVAEEYQLPKELIVAQAILESGWGQSRFAEVGNNLFGIRTFDKSENWMLPKTMKHWKGWGVKVYPTKCSSVRDYVRIINEVWAYEELRDARDNNPNISAVELAVYLDKFSTNPKYTKLVINIIKTKLGKYDLS
tara:strand:+ start:4804 stop:5475 length:672 start_codon:yes stop_codon:yes gene_type:complete